MTWIELWFCMKQWITLANWELLIVALNYLQMGQAHSEIIIFAWIFITICITFWIYHKNNCSRPGACTWFGTHFIQSQNYWFNCLIPITFLPRSASHHNRKLLIKCKSYFQLSPASCPWLSIRDSNRPPSGDQYNFGPHSNPYLWHCSHYYI